MEGAENRLWQYGGMIFPIRTSFIFLALTFAASALAFALKPTWKLADTQPRERLEALIPMQLGDWRGLPANNIVIADPRMAENLSRIYTETLSRTYVDSRGQQIMLSIAYGDDQRDGMNLHYPEVCYPAQGFQIRASHEGQINTPYGSIRVKRLETSLGSRLEPVTYWTMVGEYQSSWGIDKKINEMRYSLRGLIPDGILIRVSSIDPDSEKAFFLQESFVRDFVAAVNGKDRVRVIGKTTP